VTATADLTQVRRRLEALVDPYRDRLEAASLYGVETLRRPGAKAHDWLVGLRNGPRYVAFYLMPIYADPTLLESVSPALRKHLTGKACFHFYTVDDALLEELAGLVARSFGREGLQVDPRAHAARRRMRDTTPRTDDPASRDALTVGGA